MGQRSCILLSYPVFEKYNQKKKKGVPVLGAGRRNPKMKNQHKCGHTLFEGWSALKIIK